MTRRTLISDRPRTSEPPSERATVPGVEAAGDFGRWLTHDLRPKGAPSEIPIVERPSQPQSLLVPVLEEPELASWLLRDLKPRHSSPPEAPHPPDSLPPDSLSPDLVLPPDSLVPHAVSEAPPAAGAALLDEDLAVLPSRPVRGVQRRWRHVVVLAALLALAGAIFWRGSGPTAESGASVASASAPIAAAPLPPPPPTLFEEEEELEPAGANPSPARSSAAATEAGAETDLTGPRGRRAGDAVARFADLPLPTLSRLARDERQRSRASGAPRAAAKASSSSSP